MKSPSSRAHQVFKSYDQAQLAHCKHLIYPHSCRNLLFLLSRERTNHAGMETAVKGFPKSNQ